MLIDLVDSPIARVALRKESVDRNAPKVVGVVLVKKSLSARRAWIEIMARLSHFKTLRGSLSARRAWIEILELRTSGQKLLSLSARRAWIEISISSCVGIAGEVALRKESVDRNIND